MTTETVLQMPCLACEPPCLWPVNPPKLIRVLQFSLGNFICSDCVFLNGTYFPEFTVKNIIPGFVQCTFDSVFLFPVCGVVVARLFTSFQPATQQLFMNFGLLNNLNLPVFSYSTLFNPPESLTNGPFVLPVVTGSIQCTVIFPQVTVDAV